MVNATEQLLSEESLKDPSLFSLWRDDFNGDLTAEPSGKKDAFKETEPGSAQWHTAEGQEAMGVYWNKRDWG